MICCFQAITSKPQTLESQPQLLEGRTLKKRIFA